MVGAQVFEDCLKMQGQSQVDSWQQVLVNSQEYGQVGLKQLLLQVSIYLVSIYVTASQYGRILSKL